jgi:hypothetical protein
VSGKEAVKIGGRVRYEKAVPGLKAILLAESLLAQQQRQVQSLVKVIQRLRGQLAGAGPHCLPVCLRGLAQAEHANSSMMIETTG